MTKQDFGDAVRFVFFETGFEEWAYATDGGTAFVASFNGKPYGLTARHVTKGVEWPIVLAGCQPPAPPSIKYFRHATANYSLFLKDRYAGLKEATKNQSTGFLYGNVGSMQSGPFCSAELYVGCMAARGYYQSPGGFASPSSGGLQCR